MKEAIIGSLVAFLSAGITWIFSRRKNKAEADIAEGDARAKDLENFNSAVKIYRDIAEDTGKKLAELMPELNKTREENMNLLGEIAILREENEKFMSEIKELREENHELSKRLSTLEAKIVIMEKEIKHEV